MPPRKTINLSSAILDHMAIMSLRHSAGDDIGSRLLVARVGADHTVETCDCPASDVPMINYGEYAELFAAAPELLAACKAAQQCIVDFIELYKRDGAKLVLDEAVKSLRDDALYLARAAIAKAEGTNQ